MNTSSDEPRDDLLELGERLHAARPRLTPAELDDVKLRVRRRVAHTSGKGTPFMKSRLAIMLMLVLGLMLSTTGAGLAISGAAGSNDAAGVQYCGAGQTTPACNNNHPSNNNGTLGVQKTGSKPTTSNESGPAPAAVQETSAPQQVATSSGGQLAFTGYAGIGVLVLGLGLLCTGVVLRRRTRNE
jgi:hypothetical protein